MNEGVKILLERMKTNPEEFIAEAQYGLSKWGRVVDSYKPYLTLEDNKALDDAWKETINIIMQEKFTQVVMKELLAPEEDDSLGKPWYIGHPSGMLSAGTTLGAYSNTATITSTLQAQQAVDLQTQQVLLQIEHMKQKKSKTLFGKLFNYL